MEYPLSCLPAETQSALLERASADLPEPEYSSPLPVVKAGEDSLYIKESKPSPQPVAELKKWQRKRMEARLTLVRYLDTLREEHGCGVARAIKLLVCAANQQALPTPIQNAVITANGRPNGERVLSERSLYRWHVSAQQGNAHVAPVPARKAMGVPVWGPLLLKLYQRPQKPTLKDVVEAWPSNAQPAPNYGQAMRFIKKVSPVDLHRGRIGPNELKKLRAYVMRDTSDLWPTDIYMGDGHTFDAEIAHPDHGQPFRPEITTIIDVATRRIVGWSAGLSESTWSVLDALRNAVETAGICAIWYTDRGSGFTNDSMTNEFTGFLSRLSIQHKTSLPYNSQARGMIERAHRTVWVTAAKELPTYIGQDMDPEAKKKAFKITRKDIKEKSESRLLMRWSDFLVFCQDRVDHYNRRPHSALGQISVDAGLRRHMTPLEAWAKAGERGLRTGNTRSIPRYRQFLKSRAGCSLKR